MSVKIYVGINNKKIELKGEQLEAFLEQEAKDQAEFEAQARLIEAEQQAKEAARASAMNKLSALGLTDEEISALIQ